MADLSFTGGGQVGFCVTLERQDAWWKLPQTQCQAATKQEDSRTPCVSLPFLALTTLCLEEAKYRLWLFKSPTSRICTGIG